MVRRERADDGIDIVTLDRPESLNALSWAMVDELHGVFDDLKADPSTRVVVLTGAGRGFCAGLDLNASDEYEYDGSIGASMRGQERFASLVQRIRDLPQAVIAAVNGPAAGGGFAIALGCDIRIAARSARFNVANVRIGLSGGDLGISWLLPRLIGASNAFELMFTGRFIDGDEAARIGVATRTVDDEQLLESALDTARMITANGPFGIWMTKEVVWAQLEVSSFAAGVHLENRTQVLASKTGALEEAMSAFQEKRPPRWAPHM